MPSTGIPSRANTLGELLFEDKLHYSHVGTGHIAEGSFSLVPLFWSLCPVKGPFIRREAASHGPFVLIRDQSRGTKLEGPSVGEQKVGPVRQQEGEVDLGGLAAKLANRFGA